MEMEKELYAICEPPVQTVVITQSVNHSTDESQIEEIRHSLKQFFEESNRDHQQILVDKLRLLEKENQFCQEELKETKDLLETREQDMQAERNST